MKKNIINLLARAAADAYKTGELRTSVFPQINIGESRFEAHGDYSTNLAMVMAPIQKMPPRKIAEVLIKHIHDTEKLFAKTEIAGPGFINFFINPSAWHPVMRHINESDTQYGAINIGHGKKVQVEFVSANPTGPLHVGNGRGGAVGDSVANILSFCGYDIQREYYINDSGRQIHTLGHSVLLRYQELCGKAIQFPEDCYQGNYIIEIAGQIKAKEGLSLLNWEESQAISYCSHIAAEQILERIRDDLTAFGITFDRWYSEQSLYDSGKVEAVLQEFREKNIIYEKDGAQWFKTSDFGDEKDRVVVRQNGMTTYFASDIAYHQDKFMRGFDRIIDVWGADHHGYISRIMASILASGRSKDQFHVILTNLVNLQRDGSPIAMSKRTGEFLTLKDVINEVGKDAARFIFLTRHYESPLDFDLELAKKQTNDNPVYYVQYVHARISSILAKGHDIGIPPIVWNDQAVSLIKEPEEIHLLKLLVRYPDIVAGCAESLEPHRITFYLMELAAAFHTYYNSHRVLTDDPILTQGRLYLILAVQKVIRNGLKLLGVSAPEKM